MKVSKRASGFPELMRDIKTRIQHAQTRAVFSVNAELVRLYWDIGRIIDQRQKKEGWGSSVIPRLARELKNELPEEKGFSERNIKRMLAFYRAYSEPEAISPRPAAKLLDGPKVPQAVALLGRSAKVPEPPAQLAVSAKVPEPPALFPETVFWTLPWFHHVILMEKIKDLDVRLWYMTETLANGWSQPTLLAMIKSGVHRRKGKVISNFDRLLPLPQSELVQQTLKDPYIFDFLTLQEPFHERELETTLLRQIEKFLIELGQGFAFVGRQYHFEVGGRDFYIDLLFYHLRLRCFVAIDLKKGEFKPEYAGKMNFYLGVLDEQLRHAQDATSIGMILCQDRNRIIAEYTLRGTSKPIGVSEYELTRLLPKNLQSALPTVEQIEAEFGKPRSPGTRPKLRRRERRK